MMNLLSRDKIIALLRELDRLLQSDIEGKDHEEMMEEIHRKLKAGVLDPAIMNYIYWDASEPTPEEIADRALAYEPIVLPDESRR